MWVPELNLELPSQICCDKQFLLDYLSLKQTMASVALESKPYIFQIHVTFGNIDDSPDSRVP